MEGTAQYMVIVKGVLLTLLHVFVQCLTSLAHNGYLRRVQQEDHSVRVLGAHIHTLELLVWVCVHVCVCVHVHECGCMCVCVYVCVCVHV